jgi:hypothetical protein
VDLILERIIVDFDNEVNQNETTSEFYLPGYKAMSYGESQLMLRMNMSPPTSGLQSKPSRKQISSRVVVPVCSFWILAWFTL